MNKPIFHGLLEEDACEYGVDAAIVVNFFRFWLRQNRKKGLHIHASRAWTYQSMSDLQLEFPFLSVKQIRCAMDVLVSKGVLMKARWGDHEGHSPFDRTLWYAFADEAAWLDSIPPREPLLKAETPIDTGTSKLPAHPPPTAGAAVAYGGSDRPPMAGAAVAHGGSNPPPMADQVQCPEGTHYRKTHPEGGNTNTCAPTRASVFSAAFGEGDPDGTADTGKGGSDGSFVAEAAPSPVNSKKPRVDPGPPWQQIASEYPMRDGDRAAAKGRQVFERLVKQGEDAQAILGGVRRYAAWCAARGHERTQYVKQIPTFLNGRCWEEAWNADEPPVTAKGPRRETMREQSERLSREVEVYLEQKARS